jgi:hypothetical protein
MSSSSSISSAKSFVQKLRGYSTHANGRSYTAQQLIQLSIVLQHARRRREKALANDRTSQIVVPLRDHLGAVDARALFSKGSLCATVMALYDSLTDGGASRGNDSAARRFENLVLVRRVLDLTDLIMLAAFNGQRTVTIELPPKMHTLLPM